MNHHGPGYKENGMACSSTEPWQSISGRSFQVWIRSIVRRASHTTMAVAMFENTHRGGVNIIIEWCWKSIECWKSI